MRAAKKENEAKSKAFLDGVEHQKKIGEQEWKNREKTLISFHAKDKDLLKESLKKNEQTVKEIEKNTQVLIKQIEQNFKNEIANLKKIHKEEIHRKDTSNQEGRKNLMQELDGKIKMLEGDYVKKHQKLEKEYEEKEKKRQEEFDAKLLEMEKEKQLAVEERERWENENDFMMDLGETYFFAGKDSSKKHKEIISLLASLEEMKEQFNELRMITRKNSNRVKKFGADNRKKKLPYNLRES